MDHIVAGTQYFVPYVSYPPYDGHDFSRFPARTGWKLEASGKWANLDMPFDPRNLEAFLQSWLFFGVLEEVLGIPVEHDHFMVEVSLGSYHITTAKLGKYIESWESRVKEGGDESIGQLIHAQMILDEAHRLVSKYCTVTRPGENPAWNISPLLALSFSILGETLSYARAGITSVTKIEVAGWLEQPHFGWGYNSLVLKDMLTDGWCLFSIHNLLESLRLSACGLLYAKHLSHPKQLDLRHGKCLEDACLARQPANGFHSICHLTLDPPCRCSYIPVDLDKLLRILRAGGIPILRYEPSEQLVDVVEHKSGLSYAIISHVFADGFANVLDNSVRHCHLIKIQEILRRLSNTNQLMTYTNNSVGMKVPVYFWFDSLAIPLGDAHVDLRRRTVKYMHEMYRNASFTVVLDMGLMVQSRGRGYADAAMRITTSYWMTRLWTLQEAYLSQRVCFIFKDAIVDMDELETNFPKQITSPAPWAARRYWYALLGPERAMLRHNPGHALLTGPSFLTSLWNALALRRTGVAQHEPLAIATLLGLDTDEFDNVEFNPAGTSSSGDQALHRKMRQLLEMIAKVSDTAIPAGLAFVARPKLTEDRFSWAPISWLKLPRLQHQYLAKSQQGAKLTAGGLEVRLPGYVLHQVATNQPWAGEIREFAFPRDRTLREWLIVCVDAAVVRSDGSSLAIVTEHIPVGREWQKALLIQISRTIDQTVYSQMLCTADIKMVYDAVEISNLSMSWRNRRGSVLMGELKAPSTTWCIDGVSARMQLHARDSDPAGIAQTTLQFISKLTSRFIYTKKLE